MQELSLKYRIEKSSETPGPVFFLVHGRAGTLDVMWTFRRYLPTEATIISVQAPVADFSKGGFSWWSVEGEITRAMIEEGVGKLRVFINEVITSYGLSGRPLNALGFSQGAGTLSVLLQDSPELFEKVALLAGFVIKDEDPDTALSKSFAVKPKVLIVHGSEDVVVPLSRAEDGKEFLLAHGIEVTFVTDPVGHKVGALGMRAVREFFQ